MGGEIKDMGADTLELCFSQLFDFQEKILANTSQLQWHLYAGSSATRARMC